MEHVLFYVQIRTCERPPISQWTRHTTTVPATGRALWTTAWSRTLIRLSVSLVWWGRMKQKKHPWWPKEPTLIVNRERTRRLGNTKMASRSSANLAASTTWIQKTQRDECRVVRGRFVCPSDGIHGGGHWCFLITLSCFRSSFSTSSSKSHNSAMLHHA